MLTFGQVLWANPPNGQFILSASFTKECTDMKFLKVLALFCGLATANSAVGASINLIDVSGAPGALPAGSGLGPLGNAGGPVTRFGVAQGFTANTDITQAEISANIIGCSGTCEGRAQLVKVLTDPAPSDPNNALTQVIGDRRFCGTARTGCDELPGDDVLFDGFSLDGGFDYFLALSVTIGGSVWFGQFDNADRIVSGTGDIALDNAFAIPSANVSPADLLENTLTPLNDLAFFFSIDGVPAGTTTVATVPLPAGGLLMFAAFGSFVFVRKRRG